MGLANDKLLQLEEEGVIIWNNELRVYVAVRDQRAFSIDAEPFDLTEYLFNQARESHES